jgi:DNA adenine methylase
MKYLGSKRRIAKYILPIILKDRKEGQWYVEPFVGGANTIDKVTGNRIGGDIHFELIEMWKHIQIHGVTQLPSILSKQEYDYIRLKRHKVDPWLVGFVGFNATFGAKWFGGYARPRDLVRTPDITSGRNSLETQIPFIKDIVFVHTAYHLLDYPPNSIIYCDPPYRKTTKYKDGIDYEHFYQWCRDMKSRGHIVYVSEYNMPEDFICVWSKDQKVHIGETTLNKIERLYTL